MSPKAIVVALLAATSGLALAQWRQYEEPTDPVALGAILFLGCAYLWCKEEFKKSRSKGWWAVTWWTGLGLLGLAVPAVRYVLVIALVGMFLWAAIRSVK